MKRTDILVLRWGPALKKLLIVAVVACMASMVFGVWREKLPAILLSFSLAALAGVMTVWIRYHQEHFIREAPLPPHLQRKLLKAYPHLEPRDGELIEHGLRQFFLACLRSKGQFVAMPSQAVDTLWHEFILHTQAYRRWCHLALDKFLHHTPAEALGKKPHRNDGLRRAWHWACKEESINPQAPSRLPLLFALDAKFAIPNGFSYVPDCADIRRKSDSGNDGNGHTHCGSHFTDGSHSSNSDSGGCGTGCGADGGSDGGGDGCGGD